MSIAEYTVSVNSEYDIKFKITEMKHFRTPEWVKDARVTVSGTSIIST